VKPDKGICRVCLLEEGFLEQDIAGIEPPLRGFAKNGDGEIVLYIDMKDLLLEPLVPGQWLCKNCRYYLEQMINSDMKIVK
jgi:hypothetical protein